MDCLRRGRSRPRHWFAGSPTPARDRCAKKDLFGAANRIRTCDPVITNDVLYQLSYCGGPSSLRSATGLKTLAPDIGHWPSWQEKRGPATSRSRPGSSSMPGSSGARTMGITGRMLGGTLLSPLWISWRARNSGAAVTAGLSVAGGGGAAAAGGVTGCGGGVDGAGAATGAGVGSGSAAAFNTGELSCAAAGARSIAASRGGSTRRGAVIASLNSFASSAAFLSDGRAASGRCH